VNAWLIPDYLYLYLYSKIFDKQAIFYLDFSLIIMAAMPTHVPFGVRSHNLFKMHIPGSNGIVLQYQL
jgi:hypothetical protein